MDSIDCMLCGLPVCWAHTLTSARPAELIHVSFGGRLMCTHVLDECARWRQLVNMTE